MQRLNTGCHHGVALTKPVRYDHRRGIKSLNLDNSQRHRKVRGIDDPDRRLMLLLVSALAGIDMPGVDFWRMLPVTVAPRRIVAGGSMRLTLTRNVRVTGSACGSTWRTRPSAFTDGSSVSVTLILGFGGAEWITGAATSKTASLPSGAPPERPLGPAAPLLPLRLSAP